MAKRRDFSAKCLWKTCQLLYTRTRVPERLSGHFKSFRTHWPSEQVRLRTSNRRLKKKNLRKVETRKKTDRVNFRKDFWDCLYGQGKIIMANRDLKIQQLERQKNNRLNKQNVQQLCTCITLSCKFLRGQRENTLFRVLWRTQTSNDEIY